MDAKIGITFFICVIINYVNCAGLLRTPKVYNAVITTDENLTPSRAFPVIQPTIHETGIATYPFGLYNPYRIYYPPSLHITHPGFPHGLIPNEQIPVPQSPSQEVDPESNPEQRMLLPELEMQAQPQPNSPSQPPLNNQVSVKEEKAPIPLNEFGLPPSLVPLQSHPSYRSPIKLQPYTYNHYPLIFEPSVQFGDHYLPHYGYYPPHTFSIRQLKKSQNIPANPNVPVNKPSSSPPAPSENKLLPSKDNDLNSIKNGIANKNNEVPDVPPPPLPSGAKTQK